MERSDVDASLDFERPEDDVEYVDFNHNLERKFGLRIRHLRTSVDLSQEELAFRSGLHRNYISDVERGRRNISLRALDKLARGLGIELRDLF